MTPARVTLHTAFPSALADPSLAALALRDAALDPRVVDPALVLAADAPLVAALCDPSPGGPLDALATRIRDGTFADLLRVVQAALADAGG